MRTGAALVGLVWLSVTSAAQADPEKSPAPPPETEGWHVVRSGDGGYMQYRFSPTEAAAQEDDGWHTVQNDDGGSMQYRATPSEVTQKDPGWYAIVSSDQKKSDQHEGSLSVTPAPTAVSDAEPPPAAEAQAADVQPPAAARASCEEPQALLAQRLMEIRGVQLDPEAALLALSALEPPMTPALARDLFGRPVPLAGGAFLANVLSWDQETRALTEAVAHCLADEAK